MSNFPSPLRPPERFSARRAWLVASPFISMGALAMLLGLYGLVTRQLDLTAAKHLLTIIVVCAGVAMLIIGWFATKRTKPEVYLKAAYPGQPWRWRADWVEGRVDNSEQHSVFFLWIFCLFFNLIAWVITFAVVAHELQYGNRAAVVGLVFPLIGLGVLTFVVQTTRVWGRFGRSRLLLGHSPIRPGEWLAGQLEVPARLQPKLACYLRLSCVRRKTEMRGNTKATTERQLWQEEKWLRPDPSQMKPGMTQLPVYFALPAGLPETTTSGGDGVQWRLQAEARVSGPDFHATFELPVFSAETAPVSAEIPPDPSLGDQLTLDEIRQKIHSRITVVDRPEGREFTFPPGRNPGFALGASAIWLIWTGAVGLMVLWHAPLLFPLVFAAVDVLMTIFTFDLWLRRNRVMVTPAGMEIQTSWPGYQQKTFLPVAELASLKAEIGATAGHAVYYDLKIKTRAGQEYTAARHLNHKPEADWLIRQMAAVLKRGTPADD